METSELSLSARKIKSAVSKGKTIADTISSGSFVLVVFEDGDFCLRGVEKDEDNDLEFYDPACGSDKDLEWLLIDNFKASDLSNLGLISLDRINQVVEEKRIAKEERDRRNRYSHYLLLGEEFNPKQESLIHELETKVQTLQKMVGNELPTCVMDVAKVLEGYRKASIASAEYMSSALNYMGLALDSEYKEDYAKAYRLIIEAAVEMLAWSQKIEVMRGCRK